MLAGLALALGAPAGALLLRQGQGAGSPFDDLSANAFFYLYMLVGTSLVFGAAGFVAGMIADSLAQERDRFHELSEHDELTGLLNARAFWDRYRRAVDKTARFQEPLALLIIDVDQLKVFNDQEGHRFGDKVLQHVGRAVGKAKRADDVAARWGGDEFGILMRGAPSSAAVRVGEALLGQMRQEPVRTSRTERVVGITIGIATTERASAEGLFDRADRALYAGKRGGGNQLSVADNASPEVVSSQ